MELCNPDKTIVGILSGIKDLIITPRWGSCSEVSFTAYEKINDIENPSYPLLCKSRLIHIDGFGYFVIQDYDELYEDKIHSKSVTAYSAEYLLNNKSVNLVFITTAGDINNTDSTTTITSNYFFCRENQKDKSLLHQLILAAPQWSIGYVSNSLKDKSRSFSQTDNGLYGFLTNEVAQSYDALFVFDNEKYTINAYDTSEVIKPTNIVLSFDNLLKSASVTELSDDIYTVLNVTGAEDLDISKINPNGTKKIYCLDYYTGVLDKNANNYYENYNEWIKDNALKKKILDWEAKCKKAIYDTSDGSYSYWTELYKKFNASLITAQAELKEMQNYLDIAKQNMSSYSDYSSIDDMYVVIEKTKGWFGLGGQKQIRYGDRGNYDKYSIVDYGNIPQITTDDSYNVTWYTYWSNYSKAIEMNIKSMKDGGSNSVFKLYPFNKSDFETGEDGKTPINQTYNTNNFWKYRWTIIHVGNRKFPMITVTYYTDVKPNGMSYSNTVQNHEFPPKNAEKYTIKALEDEIALIQKKRDEIVSQFSYDSNFTDEEKKIIEPYLIEGSFSDETFIVTDSMKVKDYSDTTTKVQVVDTNGDISVKTIGELKNTDTIMDDIYVIRQLTDSGYKKLETVSQPSFSFSLESANFLFIEKFQPFIDQLLSIEKNKGSLFGAVVNVMLDDKNWVYPYLQEMSIEYDDPDNFTMSFGNRFRISDSVFTFNELHNATASATSRVGSLLSSVSQPVTNGTISTLSSYTKNDINLENQTISTSDKNEFTIGSFGIIGKRMSNSIDKASTLSVKGNDGIALFADEAETTYSDGFDPEQIWIANNKICFTTDGWLTTKAVFGKMQAQDGTEIYGLKADTLIGDLIIGRNLIISNNNESMTMDENGFSVQNDEMGIGIDPNKENVFDIYKRKVFEETDTQEEHEERTSVLTVARDGTLTITGGDLIVGDGTNGYIIDGQKGTIESVLKDKDGRPLFQLTPDGQLFTSGTTIDGSEILEPSPVVDPTGQNGVVDSQVIEMPAAFMDRLRVLVKAEWYGPYNYILDRVGKSDSEGWRNIWKYYSNRTISTMLSDIRNAGYQIIYKNDMDSAISTAINNNNTTLNDKYATKSSLDSYQQKSDMNSYYSKSDINNILGISSTTSTQWKTITVGEEQITVLAKTN